MTNRTAKIMDVQAIDKRHWAVIGGREIGGKAQALRDATANALEAGFFMSRRTIAAMEAFKSPQRWEIARGLLGERVNIDNLMHAIRTGSGEYINGKDPLPLIRQTTLTPEEEQIVLQVMKRFKAGTPLAVRSSAYGDACGNGNYSSSFVWMDDEARMREEFKLAFIKVLLSQFKTSAIAYRKDLELPEGVAVMVETVFGVRWHKVRWHNDENSCFGPDYGGYAISGTEDIEGFTIINHGLPTKAVELYGIRIGEHCGIAELSDCFKIMEYATQKSKKGHGLNGELVVLNRPNMGIWSGAIRDARIMDMFSDVSPDYIFSRLSKFTELRGIRQYVEYALRIMNGKPELALLQCANDVANDCYYAFGGKMLAEGASVENGGDKICKGIIIARSEDALDAIRRMNMTKGYLLVIYATALGAMAGMGYNKLQSNDVNQANAIIESGGYTGHGSLGGHFGGGLKERGIILAGGDDIAEGIEHAMGEIFGIPKNSSNEHTAPYQIYDVKVRVWASEREQRVIIEKAEE